MTEFRKNFGHPTYVRVQRLVILRFWLRNLDCLLPGQTLLLVLDCVCCCFHVNSLFAEQSSDLKLLFFDLSCLLPPSANFLQSLQFFFIFFCTVHVSHVKRTPILASTYYTDFLVSMKTEYLQRQNIQILLCSMRDLILIHRWMRAELNIKIQFYGQLYKL